MNAHEVLMAGIEFHRLTEAIEFPACEDNRARQAGAIRRRTRILAALDGLGEFMAPLLRQ